MRFSAFLKSCGVFFALVVLSSGQASAEPEMVSSGLMTIPLPASPSEHVDAPSEEVQELFKQGIANRDARRYQEGCPQLRSVYLKTRGPGALYELGTCDIEWGHLASGVLELEAYRKWYARWSAELPEDNRGDRAQLDELAATQIARWKGRIPTLQIRKSEGGCAATAALVKLDGSRVEGSLLGASIPLDPGDHSVSVERDGAARREEKVHLSEGESRAMQVQGDSSPCALRTGAYVVGGLGLTALVAGAVLGALALEQKGIRDANCTGLRCNEIGNAANKMGGDLADATTAGLLVGAIGLGAGVGLYVSPRFIVPGAVFSSPVRVQVGASGAGTFSAGVSASW